MNIGVLALQGAVAEHIQMLCALGVKAIPIRLPSQLDSLDGLVIPGGESTTISKLLYEYDLMEPLRLLATKGFPLFGTCAGMILLASKTTDLRWQPVGAIDIEVQRNAFGRQIDSFEADLEIPALGDKPFRGIFIRAPIVGRVNSSVDILCRLNGSVVATKQGKAIACAFHPELTDDSRFHKYFLDLVTGEPIAQGSSR
ncbi:MAG: pyridoxal 5'-phosphate synthase glutaminase subunit PdxT [Chloroflexi bacterium]|nr:pyridoxal 5'-phosphate synthase glutaminase subunit PdxT [Chloroflexota bacterium]MBM4454468.1 pyridoxal 5'-phosphate synthase glutaminase subunit PdxT [Chloroflexota bacterium]